MTQSENTTIPPVVISLIRDGDDKKLAVALGKLKNNDELILKIKNMYERKWGKGFFPFQFQQN